jgi:ABC-2 type transport system permease protein
MLNETVALAARALRKWIRNPTTIGPGLATAVFYLALLGSSFNPNNLIPSGVGGGQILQVAFGGAPTYITYLTSGVICIVILSSMAFGGINLVLDRQLGFLNTILTAPIPRASVYLSGVAQNLAKVLLLAALTFAVAFFIPKGLELPTTFSVVGIFGIFAAFALLGLGLSFGFTALALATRSIDSLVAMGNFLTLPVIFMSNTFFPTSSFPAWLREVADVNPVTKANEAARLLLLNGSLTASQLSTYCWDVTYLLAFAMVLGVIGYVAAMRAIGRLA